MNLNNRLEELIIHLNHNARSFAKELGYERGDNINNLLTGKTKGSTEILERITKRFDNVNYAPGLFLNRNR